MNSKTWPNISVNHKSQPLENSNRPLQPVLTTLGSTDQGGYNQLKPLVKTRGGFDRPTLFMTKQNSKWSKPLIIPLTIWNCVLPYNWRIISVKTALFFQEITFITEFPGSNFLLSTFLKVANGIFTCRWQICYLLLLISNPGRSRSECFWCSSLSRVCTFCYHSGYRNPRF